MPTAPNPATSGRGPSTPRVAIGIGVDHCVKSGRDSFVDLHERPGGSARAHEVRLAGGDCTWESFR